MRTHSSHAHQHRALPQDEGPAPHTRLGPETWGAGADGIVARMWHSWNDAGRVPPSTPRCLTCIASVLIPTHVSKETPVTSMVTWFVQGTAGL